MIDVVKINLNEEGKVVWTWNRYQFMYRHVMYEIEVRREIFHKTLNVQVSSESIVSDSY